VIEEVPGREVGLHPAPDVLDDFGESKSMTAIWVPSLSHDISDVS
jgi:hypothetical protein